MLISRAGRVLASRTLSTAATVPKVDKPKVNKPKVDKPKVTITFKASDGSGDEEKVTCHEGDSLLDVAHDNDIEIEGACGGEMACSTCHVILEKRIFDTLPKPKDEEEDMLDLALGLTKTSRLGCQVCVTKNMEGMVVSLPKEVSNLQTKT